MRQHRQNRNIFCPRRVCECQTSHGREHGWLTPFLPSFIQRKRNCAHGSHTRLNAHPTDKGDNVSGTMATMPGMVQAWVAHFVTPIPTLGLFVGTCLHTTSDDNQTRPQHTTQTHNKHHHHGGGATNPSDSMDLMIPR